MRAVVDDLSFRHFQDDAVGGDARLLGGFDGGENRFRIRVEALRQKIEMQRAVDAETSGKRDCGDASSLIEEVKIGRRDLVEDLPGGLAPWAANESFPANNLASDGVDDGLKGEGEGRIAGEQLRGLGNELGVGAHHSALIVRPANWIGDDMQACGRNAARLPREISAVP